MKKIDLSKYDRELARIRNIDLAIEDHGFLVLSGEVEYESGTCSGLPDYIVNAAYIYRLMRALGVDSLKEANGKSLWFLYEKGKSVSWGGSITDGLVGFAPLHPKDGTPFILADWKEWSKKNCSHSMKEIGGDA